MQEIRQGMRGHAEILMGKNTMIRKAIRGQLQQNPALEKSVYIEFGELNRRKSGCVNLYFLNLVRKNTQGYPRGCCRLHSKTLKYTENFLANQFLD